MLISPTSMSSRSFSYPLRRSFSGLLITVAPSMISTGSPFPLLVVLFRVESMLKDLCLRLDRPRAMTLQVVCAYIAAISFALLIPCFYPLPVTIPGLKRQAPAMPKDAEPGQGFQVMRSQVSWDADVASKFCSYCMEVSIQMSSPLAFVSSHLGCSKAVRVSQVAPGQGLCA